MKRARLFILGIGFGFVLPTVLLAETAFTTRTVNMRAGPSKEYPLVMQLPGGTPVDVGGCVDDWTWCDVFVGPDRGWVYAGNLEYPYQDHRVTIMTYGPRIGLPIVPFVPGIYWDTYYRGRPWYGRRHYWVERAPSLHHGPAVVRVPAPRAVVVRPAGPRPAVVHPAPGPRPENRPHVQAAKPAPAPRVQPRPSEHKRPGKP
jgi:uncharacterized protein YraI